MACDVAPQLWDVWYLASDESVELSFAGGSYSYRIETPQELKRYKTLMGERELLEHLLTRLESEDVFYDIGSNVGLYTVPAAERCETVAFDPVSVNTSRVRNNLARNGLEADVRTTALGRAERTAKLHLPDGPVGGATSLAPVDADERVSVPVRSVDGLVSNGDVPSPTVVKIDVEGAEQRVLEGMEESLDDVRLALIEVHRSQLRELGSSPDELIAYLESHGFDVTRTHSRSESNFHVLAVAE